jgi:hypothetical protein
MINVLERIRTARRVKIAVTGMSAALTLGLLGFALRGLF